MPLASQWWGRLSACRRLSGGVLLLLCASALAQEPATITGRVFDAYHRPVPAARVVPMRRRIESGKLRLIPGNPQALVNEAGMYRLSLPPGHYLLAVTPPPKPLDFATIFPAFLGDIVDPENAPSIDVKPGELRPSVDFLLLEVESHRLTGKVTGIPPEWLGASVEVSLHAANVYTGTLRTVLAGTSGDFLFDHLPAGSYELTADGPVTTVRPDPGNAPRYGSIHVDVAAPEITGIQIHLRARAR